MVQARVLREPPGSRGGEQGDEWLCESCQQAVGETRYERSGQARGLALPPGAQLRYEATGRIKVIQDSRGTYVETKHDLKLLCQHCQQPTLWWPHQRGRKWVKQ